MRIGECGRCGMTFSTHLLFEVDAVSGRCVGCLCCGG
jgi:hypothetical protein